MFDLMDTMAPLFVYGVMAIDVAFGVLLLGAAGAARMPRTLRVLSVLFILEAIFIPLIGIEGFRDIIDSMYGTDTGLVRAAMALGLACYLFLIYALLPRREETPPTPAPA